MSRNLTLHEARRTASALARAGRRDVTVQRDDDGSATVKFGLPLGTQQVMFEVWTVGQAFAWTQDYKLQREAEA